LAKKKEDSKKDTNQVKKKKIVDKEALEKSTSKSAKKSSTAKKSSPSTKKDKSKSKVVQEKSTPKKVKKEKIEKTVKEVEIKEVKKEIPDLSLETKESNQKEVSSQKAYFFPRVLAYLIDIMIVTVLSSLVISVVPENKNYATYLTEYQKIQSSFLEGDMDADEYVNKSAEIVYDIDYSNVLPMIVEVGVLILYFIVFQFYNKGQTLGKRLLKIRVVSENDGEVSMNQYILRSFIIPSIISKMLIIALVLFLGREYYYYCSFTVQGIQVMLIIVSIFMVMYSKTGRGLHDRLAKTKVIMTD